MRITIQMELKPGPLHKYMHVLNYNCMALEDNFIMW